MSAMAGTPTIVVLGMLSVIPVGGVVWQVLHYLLGFSRLGFDVYYVESHARTPGMLMTREDDDSSAQAAAYIHEQLRPFGLGQKWAFHALHDDGRCYGLSRSELRRLYREAALIVNLHGGTVPLPEHAATGRLVYLETDPVQLQIELHDEVQATSEFLEPHVAFFTAGLNYGNADCLLPWSERFPFVPSPPPVLLELWAQPPEAAPCFTTIGNWRQQWREVNYRGETYTWSKHHEFLKVMDLPRRTGQEFELALSSCEDEDRRELELAGWRVRPGLEVSRSSSAYRDYVQGSRGEFTAAKDQNIRLRTGWFSERSAMYLAAGRPVVTQDTAFGNAVPAGEGLLAFTDMDSAAAAVDSVNSDYKHHSRMAVDVARGCLDSDVVLSSLLDRVGVDMPRPPSRRVRSSSGPLPTPAPNSHVTADGQLGRHDVLRRPVPAVAAVAGAPRDVTVLVRVTADLARARAVLETLLANSAETSCEILVLGTGGPDLDEYLSVLSARNAHVRRVSLASADDPVSAGDRHVAVVLPEGVLVPAAWLTQVYASLQDAATVDLSVVCQCSDEPAKARAFRPRPSATWSDLMYCGATFAAHPTTAESGRQLQHLCAPVSVPLDPESAREGAAHHG